MLLELLSYMSILAFEVAYSPILAFEVAYGPIATSAYFGQRSALQVPYEEAWLLGHGGLAAFHRDFQPIPVARQSLEPSAVPDVGAVEICHSLLFPSR